MSKRAPTLDDYRFDGASAAKPKRFDLAAIDPGEKPFSSGDKAVDKARVDQLAGELDTLQDMFYADRRFKLLVVLQGMDTAGKDGTVRGVFGRMSALGVTTVGWKAPSAIEQAHDYLWRIHQKVPGNGEVTLFNRSHYEDVLVPVVNKQITPEQTAQRYAQINDFERMLVENGTVLLKFMLHISKEEQRKRLQERIDDPAKHWKFEGGDLTTRKQWSAFQDAYQAAVSATGTKHAPWTIVPADSKTHRNLMIAMAVKEALEGLKLSYPKGDPSLDSIKVV